MGLWAVLDSIPSRVFPRSGCFQREGETPPPPSGFPLLGALQGPLPTLTPASRAPLRHPNPPEGATPARRSSPPDFGATAPPPPRACGQTRGAPGHAPRAPQAGARERPTTLSSQRTRRGHDICMNICTCLCCFLAVKTHAVQLTVFAVSKCTDQGHRAHGRRRVAVPTDRVRKPSCHTEVPFPLHDSPPVPLPCVIPSLYMT